MANDKPANTSTGDNESKFLAAIENMLNSSVPHFFLKLKFLNKRFLNRQKKKA